MHLRITCDENEGSGVGEVVSQISGPTRKHFVTKDYGAGLQGLVVVLMCRNSALNFKRRIRFAKKDKTLYTDVMLDFEQMRYLVHQDRMRIISERLADEIPTVIRKYSIQDFDEVWFDEDWKGWLKSIS